MTNANLNLKDAEKNTMQAIYPFSATGMISLTPENCRDRTKDALMANANFNLNAAEQNIMQAIYSCSSTGPTPLTPDNCEGRLRLSKDGKDLYFTTNNLAEMLAPTTFSSVVIRDDNSHLHLDAPSDDGEVAIITLIFLYDHADFDSNTCHFACFRFNAAGEIIEINFSEALYTELTISAWSTDGRALLS